MNMLTEQPLTETLRGDLRGAGKRDLHAVGIVDVGGDGGIVRVEEIVSLWGRGRKKGIDSEARMLVS